MDELVKSIRIGTVDFFGIVIPGVLLITMLLVGAFMPLVTIIMDVSMVSVCWQELVSQNMVLILFALVILAYVFGYILRLSSPDELDKISADYVIDEEVDKTINIEKDGWPYNRDNKLEKYPYSKFREYLQKRGHRELTEKLVTWGEDENPAPDATWPDEKDGDGNPIPMTKRSKTTVNKLKMKVRIHSSELSGLIESKEGHIRLMAGTWAAFRTSTIPIIFGLVFSLAAGILSTWLVQNRFFPLSQHVYWVYAFLDLTLLLIIWKSNERIKHLFHYRRVSELFHIVQAAYFVEYELPQKGVEQKKD
jgi:hypothetical protein